MLLSGGEEIVEGQGRVRLSHRSGCERRPLSLSSCPLCRFPEDSCPHCALHLLSVAENKRAGGELRRPFSMTLGPGESIQAFHPSPCIKVPAPGHPLLGRRPFLGGRLPADWAQQLQLRKANAEAEGDWGIPGKARGRQDRGTAVPWPPPLGWPKEEAGVTGSAPRDWPCLLLAQLAAAPHKGVSAGKLTGVASWGVQGSCPCSWAEPIGHRPRAGSGGRVQETP